MNHFLYKVIILILYINTGVCGEQETSFKTENLSFLVNCVLPTLRSKEYTSASLIEKIRAVDYRKIPFYNMAELINFINNMSVTNSEVNFVTSNEHCFRNYLEQLAVKYKLDKQFLFTNQMNFFSQTEREAANLLTNSSRHFFLMFYRPSTITPSGVSWSQFYGTTVLSVPYDLAEIEQSMLLSPSDPKIGKFIAAINDIERQFVHEYFVKRDAIQSLGTGGLTSLTKDLRSRLGEFDQNLSLEEVKLLNQAQVRFALINYRATIFEQSKGLGNKDHSNLSCSQIVSRYSVEPLKKFTNDYEKIIPVRLLGWLVRVYSLSRRNLLTDRASLPTIEEFANLDVKVSLLDKNEVLCDLLKTPILQEGEYLPLPTDGPGCVSCTTGW